MPELRLSLVPMSLLLKLLPLMLLKLLIPGRTTMTNVVVAMRTHTKYKYNATSTNKRGYTSCIKVPHGSRRPSVSACPPTRPRG